VNEKNREEIEAARSKANDLQKGISKALKNSASSCSVCGSQMIHAMTAEGKSFCVNAGEVCDYVASLRPELSSVQPIVEKAVAWHNGEWECCGGEKKGCEYSCHCYYDKYEKPLEEVIHAYLEGETKDAGKAIDRLMVEGVTDEAYKDFTEKLETFGEKFDAARKTEATHCFCGEVIDDPKAQEVSPSMYYFNRRTCSNACHNKWILGQFDEDRGGPVGKGWMPIIEQLDKDITALDPDYSITQIKEKFGTLRYYADFQEPELPLGITNEEVWALSSIKSDLYGKVDRAVNPDEWYGKDEERPEPLPDWKLERMKKDLDNLQSLVDKLQPIQALIDKAEEESAIMCEWCSHGRIEAWKTK